MRDLTPELSGLMAAKELTVSNETARGRQVRSNDQLGVVAGFRIEHRGRHTIKVWDDGGCEPATAEEVLMWYKLVEARVEIERLRSALTPLAGLFLPEDTGIYGAESWQEPLGDMPDDQTTNDFFVAYGDIRRARKCLPVTPNTGIKRRAARTSA